MSKRLRRVAVPVIAAAMIASTTATVWAFTQETLNPNGNYNFNFGPLDGKGTSGGSLNKPDDPNSPGLHFNIQSGQQASPFGFRSFGGDDKPEVPGSRPLGNGN